jgi:hypothetical protein
MKRSVAGPFETVETSPLPTTLLIFSNIMGVSVRRDISMVKGRRMNLNFFEKEYCSLGKTRVKRYRENECQTPKKISVRNIQRAMSGSVNL